MAETFVSWSFFAFGFGTGFGLAWAYFAWCRLLRTRHEWYMDPEVQKLYPKSSAPYVEAFRLHLQRGFLQKMISVGGAIYDSDGIEVDLKGLLSETEDRLKALDGRMVER
jgi:hypothetical protein